MDNLQTDIIDNVNSIIYQRYSEGIKALSSKKIIDYIKKKYSISLDDNSLGDLLKDNPHVSDIANGKINMTSDIKNDTQKVNNDIHDTAVDQAGSDMFGDGGLPMNDGMGADMSMDGDMDLDMNADNSFSGETSIGGSESTDTTDSSSDMVDTADLGGPDLGNVDLNDLKQESVFNLLKSLDCGSELDPNRVMLDESNLYYHLHNGVKKSKSNYIVCDVLPKSNIMESIVKCKVNGTSILIDIPLKNIKK